MVFAAVFVVEGSKEREGEMDNKNKRQNSPHSIPCWLPFSEHLSTLPYRGACLRTRPGSGRV